MKKTDRAFQEQFRGRQFYNDGVLQGISGTVKLHDELRNPLSSAASCLNVMGFLNQHPEQIIGFFREFALEIDKVLAFPAGADVDGEVYDDRGPIVFEWVGPKLSPINEKGGSRGQQRTSVDAYMICRIHGKVTQVFIEWKFTENYTSGKVLHNFGGLRGVERLRRYSSVLAKLRGDGFPFRFQDEDTLGIQDFSYEPFYQLLRMTLLARRTTPVRVGPLAIEDYVVLHAVHSENHDLLNVQPGHVRYCPGIACDGPQDLHRLWISLLSESEAKRFRHGYWDKAIARLADPSGYLANRY